MIILVPVPRNDNALESVRPLSLEDIEIIISDHAVFLANAIDLAIQQFGADEVKTRSSVLKAVAHHPDVLRDIVHRGSWLKRPAVDALTPVHLVTGCAEVLAATHFCYVEVGKIEEATALIRELLRPHSTHLRAS